MRRLFASLAPLVLSLAACADDEPRACPMETSADDAGDLTASKAQRCNVPGSMGSAHWYKLAAEIPGQIVEVDLWDNRGPFAGDTVQPGTYTLAGDDLDPVLCGVCLRARADKGLPTEREYFATGGTVEVTAVAPDADAPFVATITNATFAEVGSDKSLVGGGCTGEVARVKVSGTMEIKGGTGGGTGGGGGSGAAGCLFTVGD